MRGSLPRSTAFAILGILLLTPTLSTAEPAKRRQLTTREACWYLGLRFAGTGMNNVLGARVARKDMVASYERLKQVTGMNLKDFPRVTGNTAQDGPRLGSFLRRARPKLARILSGKYDASHGALFRLALDAQILAVGYEPGHKITQETLTDMRSALTLARLPARLLLPVIRLVQTKRPRHEAPPILSEFGDDVSDLLRREAGKTLPGALHPSDPPNPLDVWRLSAYGAQAFLLHVYGQTRSGFAEALDEQAKQLDVSPPRFPKRDPKDMRKTTRAAYDYLTQKWSPTIVYRWEFRHADTSRALFSIPLLAISLRMDYAPGASWVKPKSAMLKRHARYADLPPKLILPLTKLLDAGAPVRKVHRAIADLLLDVETYYKQQAAAEPKR